MSEKNALNLRPDFYLPEIAAHFSLKGTIDNARPFGSGHIHDTFLIQTREHDCPDYILQRINHAIFQDVPRLMENIVKSYSVLDFVGRKYDIVNHATDQTTQRRR